MSDTNSNQKQSLLNPLDELRLQQQQQQQQQENNTLGSNNQYHINIDDVNVISSTTDPLQSSPVHDQSMSDIINPTRSTVYIIILTIVVGALQLAWSTEFSEGTPFLLSLGISKQVLALIWIAGPISGAIGQPIIGIYSDQCNSPWGRRRPFIMGGCIATSLSLIYLSHSTSLIGIFVPSTYTQDQINKITVPFAALGVYVLDFSIASIQAACRALIVDCVPTNQQQIANAWAARMIGSFNIVGFWIGTLNLVDDFSFLGDTQFKNLSIIVATTMFSLTLFSCLYIKERDPRTDISIINEKKRQIKKLRELGIENTSNFWQLCKSLYLQTYHSIKKLPPQVKIVCYAEFFAWIGYFPMLFYTTTYVGELYLFEKGYTDPNNLPPDSKQQLLDESTRRGTLALLVHAIVSLLIDLLIPILVEFFKDVENSNKYKKLSKNFTVSKIWIYSHIVFIIGTLSTFFIKNSNQCIVMFGFLGITWGVAVWAPFVLISEEISRIKDIKAASILQNNFQEEDDSSSTITTDATTTPSISDYTKSSRYVVHPRLLEKYDDMEYDSGILLAIHNMFVSSPQMVSSLGSSLLFWWINSQRQEGEFDTSLSWVFRIGGVATFLALYFSFKVKSNTQLKNEDQIYCLNI
ncbi:hypothetical protein B5S29_g5237 [[Candida] boidinii]|nr:hypothetical protein B5S29_g5237 [[Candida] boidinii]